MRRILLVLGAVACAVLGWTYWGVTRTEQTSLAEVRQAGEMPFTWQPYTGAARPGWDVLATPADFRDACIWNGRLYIAGSSALFAYSREGVLEQTWRAGLELPPAPLSSLAAGEELWIGTVGEGALSFDGTRFQRLLPAEKGMAKVRALLPLATGGVLLGTDGRGVVRFDGQTLRPTHPSLDKLAVTALAGVEEDLWVGTRDRGALHLRAGQADALVEKDGLTDDAVQSLAVAGEAAYIGTATGIAEFRSGRFVRKLGAGLLAESLLVRGGELHVGTLRDGWVKIPLEARARATRGELGEGEMRRVFVSGEDVFLLAPDSLEVVHAGQRQRALQPARPLLTHGNISALNFDAAGRLWVGYFDRGLDMVEANRERITHVEDDKVFCVNRIQPSTDGQQMAVATANGLALFDAGGKLRQVLTRADGLIASHVTDVLPRGKGWVLGTPAGITFLAGGARSVYAFQGLVNNHVYTLGMDGETLLAGTLGGISALRGESVQRSFNTANSGLKTNWVTALARFDGEWLAGTYGGGVQRWDGEGAWRTFDTMPANVVVNPNALVATATAVYAGTLEHGLLVYDRARASWRSVRAGLPSVNVTAIHYHDKRLYLGTENGLVTVVESSLGN